MAGLKRSLLSSALIAGSVGAAMPVQGAIYELIALTGDPVPTITEGQTLTQLHDASINNAGTVIFHGYASGEGFGGSGLWAFESGILRNVVQSGQTTPGLAASTVFGSMGSGVINEAGDIAFQTVVLDGLDSSRSGPAVWLEQSGQLKLVARYGQVFSQSSTRVFGGSPTDSWYGLSLNDHGDALFTSDYRIGSDLSIKRRGLWVANPDELKLIASEGASPFGPFSSVRFDTISQGLSIQTNSTTSFFATLEGPGIIDSNSRAHWIVDESGLKTFARTGESFAELEDGVVPTSLGNLYLNDSGEGTWKAFLFGPGITSSNNDTMWVRSGESTQLVLRGGDSAPGTEADTIFRGFWPYLMTADGKAVFEGELAGPSVEGHSESLWFYEKGVAEIKARVGFQAHGVGADVVYESFVNRYAGSESGHVLFSGFLDGPGVDNSNDFGIWVIAPDGEINLLIREGDVIDIDADPLAESLATITYMDYSGISNGEDGKPSPINSFGTAVLTVGFADGREGILLATVPEPSILGAVCFIACATRWPKRSVRLSG